MSPSFRSIVLNLATLALLTTKPIDVDAEPKEALEAKSSDNLSVLVGPKKEILEDFASIDPSKRLALAVSDNGNAMLVIANTTAGAFEVPTEQVQAICDLNKGQFVFFHQITTVGEKANVALIDGTGESATAPFVMSFAREVAKTLEEKGEKGAMFIASNDSRTMQAWLKGSAENVEIPAPFDAADLRHKIDGAAIVIAPVDSNKYALLPEKQLVAYLELNADKRDIVGYSNHELDGNVEIKDMSLDVTNGQFVLTTTDGYLLASIVLGDDGFTGKIEVKSTIEIDEAPAIVRADGAMVVTLDRGYDDKFAVRHASDLDPQLQDALLAAAA